MPERFPPLTLSSALRRLDDADLPSLAGGLLIGLAATIFLIADGRVAGISGVVDELAGRDLGRVAVNAAFALGLVLGPLLFRAAFGAWPQARASGSLA